MNAWTRGTARIEQTDEILRVQNLVRNLIENAYPLFLSTSNEGGHVDFDGASTSISLLSANPTALGIAGRSYFRLFGRTAHGDLADLRLTSIPELAWPGVSSRPAPQTLLAGAEKVAFFVFWPAKWRSPRRRGCPPGAGRPPCRSSFASRSPFRRARRPQLAGAAGRATHHRGRELHLRSAHRAPLSPADSLRIRLDRTH